MKLSRSVSYAVGVLLRLVEEDGGPCTAAKIAKGCRFPPRFLYRVLRRLVSSGLLKGVSGPGGGYALAKKPRDISLWDIVVAAEGKPRPVRLAAVAPRFRPAMEKITASSRRQLAAAEKEMRKLRLASMLKK